MHSSRIKSLFIDWNEINKTKVILYNVRAPRIFCYHREASASTAETLVSSYSWMKFVINQREEKCKYN